MTRLRPYGAFVRLAAAEAAAGRSVLLVRMVFMFVVVGVFSSLWRTALGGSMSGGLASSDLVWYLAVTEWVYLSVPLIQFDVEREVRSGDVAYRLGRPLSYPLSWLAHGVGALACRLPFLAGAAAAAAWTFTRHVPALSLFLWIIPFGIASAILLTTIHLLIGLLAFWLPDVLPIQWVSQKLLFVAGGLMLPLSFYPVWLQTAARWSPMPWILWGPAAFVLGATPSHAATLAWHLGLWLFVAGALSWWLSACAEASLQVNGG
jgi:ABC-2 type transport system permease protein